MTGEHTIKRWNGVHCFLMLAAGCGVLLLADTWPVLLLAGCSFIFFLVRHFDLLRSIRPFGGYANQATALRLLFVFLAGLSWPLPGMPWTFIFALIVVSADGIDGYLARKYKQDSEFGAYFDMETDALLVCLLCSMFYLEGWLGGWILFMGYLRYLYVMLIYIFGLQGLREGSTRFAKTIAVIFFIALLFPFVFPPVIYYPVIGLASLLVVYSFGVSFRGLLVERAGKKKQQ